MKLHTYPGNYRVFKILIAAEYNGIEIDIPEFDMSSVRSKSFLEKNPLGKVPVLETDEGSIFESDAIARYIARIRLDKKLYGSTLLESAQVDSWIDFSTHELDMPIQMLLYPILGYLPFDATAKLKAVNDLKQALQILDNYLHLRTYLVGENITLADIVIASILVYPMKFFIDKDFRKPYSNLNRWLQTLYNQPQFLSVIGDVPFCDVPTLAAGDAQPTKGQAKKTPSKSDKPERVEEAPKKPAKVEHPLVKLNREHPSKFVLDAWKVEYSNSKDLRKSMEYFWKNVDLDGYSIWFCDFMYNEENSKIFMTSNAVRGFMQRTDSLRKFAFGVMDVCGEEGKEIIITGCWLFRGDNIQYLLDENPDAESYTWTRVTTFDDAAKERVAAYWCNEEELEGKVIADSKVFK